MQQERQGGSPNLIPGCKSLGSYEREWDTGEKAKKLEPRSPKEHKHRGGLSNHGVRVEPGQDLNKLPIHHPRRRSYSAQ